MLVDCDTIVEEGERSFCNLMDTDGLQERERAVGVRVKGL